MLQADGRIESDHLPVDIVNRVSHVDEEPLVVTGKSLQADLVVTQLVEQVTHGLFGLLVNKLLLGQLALKSCSEGLLEFTENRLSHF